MPATPVLDTTVPNKAQLQTTSPSASASVPTFAALGVPAKLVAVLAADGKDVPFPIQADTLTDTLAGRDVLGRGKTGSGKTLAFCLPLAARIATIRSGVRRQPGRPIGLILAPTRELVNQIEAVLKPLAAANGLTTTTIFGGVKQGRQVDALKRGVDIVVACPGRLDDLMKQGFVSLDAVAITVLDEADHMADLGFLPVVTRILAKTPPVGQRMLFSATLDNGVDKIVRRFLTDPILHSVDSAESPVTAMTHHVFAVATAEIKDGVVTALASGTGRCILFMRTKHHAKKLAKRLTADGIPAVDLHGNLSQPARERNLAAFGDGTVKVLVATDVAARGVHVDDVELVVHVDPPTEHKAYLHRSGRTARAGHAGDVVTICLPGERKDLSDLLRKAKIDVKPEQVTATSNSVVKLVGEVAAYVKPQPIAVAAAQNAGSGRRRGSGAGVGVSQGANAQRKRAARTERDTRPASAGGRTRQDGQATQARAARSGSTTVWSSGPRADSRAGSRTPSNAGSSRGRGAGRAQGDRRATGQGR